MHAKLSHRVNADLHKRSALSFAVLLALTVAGCTMPGESNRAPVASPASSVGPTPSLPAPQSTLLPTVKIAEATGWPKGSKPMGANGLAVSAFASGLDHPRWLLALPNGDILVAETNAPPRSQDASGIKGFVMKHVMSKAGATAPTANRITLLRDVDGDGIAEVKEVFLHGLNSPFGMALVGTTFYVANTDAIVAYPYVNGQKSITAPGRKLTDLPAGPINHHWTKNIIASPDGSTIYATVGSNSNVGENGVQAEAGRAAIWEVDLASGNKRLYATGLRNPNGMAWAPSAGQSGTEGKPGTLWTVVNERDGLGNDLVPDYLTSVDEGAFYGFPYSYYGQYVDVRVEPARPDLVNKAVVPDFALGAHVAPLGLVSAETTELPAPFSEGMFIGEHGSWNRDPPAGYKVVFVPFANGQPSGMPVDVLTGFVDQEGKARGRPVGVVIDARGALLVADDVGNSVWRVTAAP